MTTYTGIDIFAVKYDLDKYPLVAYRLDTPNPDEAGGAFAKRVRTMNKIPCFWFKDQKCLIAGAQFKRVMAQELLNQLHQMALPTLQNTTSVEPIPNLQVTPMIIAEYVAKGILDLAHDIVSSSLESEKVTIGNVLITRQVAFKGLVVGGTTPTLQITVRSVMTTNQSLEDYLRQHGNDKTKSDGLTIKCRKTSGVFDGIIGKLDDLTNGGTSHRNRLKGYNPSDYPAEWLDTLPSDHLVVALKPNYSKTIYHYPIKAIKMVVSMANLHLFTKANQEQQSIAGHLKLPPEKRYKMVQTVWRTLQTYFNQQHIPVDLASAYTQQSNPEHFSNAEALRFKPELRFANKSVIITQDSKMLPAIQQNGIFKLVTSDIKMAIVDAIPGEGHREQRLNQLTRLRDQFADMKITLKRATELLHVTETHPTKQRDQLRGMIKKAISANPDIILIYLPDSERDTHRNDDPISLYNVSKEVTIGAGIVSQVVYQKTLGNNYAVGNIIMGILGKTGNIPYVLANPLSFADVVVGLDIGRKNMSKGGSLNVGAMSRVYLNNGYMLGYNSYNGKVLEGETIPPQVLENILSREEFGGKRVIIHRDGRFPNTELENLMEWGKVIQAEFYPIEVTKSGTPRIYRHEEGKVEQPVKHTIFYLDAQTAFIVTTPPPSFKTTAQPLKIHNLSKLTLDQALLSVIGLTLLHYGSVRPPRLPVSTHASDKIADFYLRDIHPNQPKGDKPFWL